MSKIVSYTMILMGLLISCGGGGQDSPKKAWVVSNFAGSGTAGSENGDGDAAQFNDPFGVAVDSSGNIYVADASNHLIRKISPEGEVSKFAGSGTEGSANGVGDAAQFREPHGIAVDTTGNIYVADSGNHQIRKITPEREVSTIAGSGTAGSANGVGGTAQFNNPYGVVVDSSGNIYVADASNHQIRKITTNSSGDVSVSPLAGSGTRGFANGVGTAARFDSPTGVAVDSSGNIYVAANSNSRIQRITIDSNDVANVDTFAGSKKEGVMDGVGGAAQFNNPQGVAVDSFGNIYVADSGNHLIRKITPEKVVSTLAGSGTAGFKDGAGRAAQFDWPSGVAVDLSGNIYVADSYNHRIRKIEYKVP